MKIYIIAAIAVLGFSAGWITCAKKTAKIEDLEKLIKHIEITNTEFEKKTNELGNVVATQRATIFEYSKKLDKVLAENTRLRGQVDSQLKAILALQVKNKEALADRPPQIIRDTVFFASNTKFEYLDQCIAMYARLGNAGLILDSLTAKTDATVTFDKKRNVSLTLSNPCIQVCNMSSVYQKDKEKWHQSKWFWFSLGAVTGLGATAGAIIYLK